MNFLPTPKTGVPYQPAPPIGVGLPQTQSGYVSLSNHIKRAREGLHPRGVMRVIQTQIFDNGTEKVRGRPRWVAKISTATTNEEHGIIQEWRTRTAQLSTIRLFQVAVRRVLAAKPEVYADRHSNEFQTLNLALTEIEAITAKNMRRDGVSLKQAQSTLVVGWIGTKTVRTQGTVRNWDQIVIFDTHPDSRGLTVLLPGGARGVKIHYRLAATNYDTPKAPVYRGTAHLPPWTAWQPTEE